MEGDPGRGKVPSIVNIDPSGDLMLHINHPDYVSQVYRVSISILRSKSLYFDSLLDPTKFSEGLAIHNRRIELSQQYSNVTEAPPSELPRVTILDIGEIPSEPISESVFRHFLGVLHNYSTSSSVPRTHFIAILVLIADRFDAVKPVARYMTSHGWMKDPIKVDRHSKSDVHAEIILRQRILIGLIVRSSTWLAHYSASLIREGSERWTTDSANTTSEAIWWHLPHGIEDELFHRRNCILNTIGALQSHFLQLYISKQLQCKLGYDSSPQCDSFQLGEMVRFYVRKGSVSMQNTFGAALDPQPFIGNLDGLISLLRQIPTYQVDKHHVHCGPRTRLEPVLASLATFPHIGICLRCWERTREDSWLENPTGGHWIYRTFKIGKEVDQCQLHKSVKAMYTADERDWTPPV